MLAVVRGGKLPGDALAETAPNGGPQTGGAWLGGVEDNPGPVCEVYSQRSCLLLCILTLLHLYHEIEEGDNFSCCSVPITSHITSASTEQLSLPVAA